MPILLAQMFWRQMLQKPKPNPSTAKKEKSDHVLVSKWCGLWGAKDIWDHMDYRGLCLGTIENNFEKAPM